MARGYIYVITKNSKRTFDPMVSEDDFYPYIKELGVDFVRNTEGLNQQADFLLEILKQYGFETGIDDSIVDKESYPVRWFIPSKEAKENYFRHKFERAKKLMDKLTLEVFMKNDPFSLRMALNDSYGDIFYVDDPESKKYPVWNPVDDVLRDDCLDYGEKYYIVQAILMH